MFDVVEKGGSQDAGSEIIDEEAKIEMARQWYEKLPFERQERIKDLFIAELNVVQTHPARAYYHKHGFKHPQVIRGFMLHIAKNLEKRRNDQRVTGEKSLG